MSSKMLYRVWSAVHSTFRIQTGVVPGWNDQVKHDNLIKTSHFSDTGSGLRQGDRSIVVSYTKLCRLLDIDITMQCAVVESKSNDNRKNNMPSMFVIQKCFGVRQPKFRQQTNS